MFDIVVKKQIECGLAWCTLLSKTIGVITVVKIYCRLTHIILTTVMTRVVVDMSAHHA